MKTTSTPTPILRRLLLCVLLLLGAGVSQSAVIITNGPIVTNPGQGYEGADVSLATAALNNQTGFLMNKVSNYRLADDFTVPVDQKWNLTAIRFFGYENNSGTTPTNFTGLYARIWDGRPSDPTATVVWGNDTANILAGSSFSGIYRVRDTESITNFTRPVMTLDGTASTSLVAGTYWLEWMTTGSFSTPTGGPWDPPISIVGQLATGNAMRFIPGTGWTDAKIGVNPQGFPFELEGTVDIVPEPGQWAMMSVTLLGVAGVVLRRYRRSCAP